MSAPQDAVRADRGSPASWSRRRAYQGLRFAGAVLGGSVFLFLFQPLLGFNLLDPGLLNLLQGSIWIGFSNTLYFVAIVIPLGVIIGFFAGWSRISKYKVLAYPAGAFVDFVRGIPPIVLVLFAFFFGPLLVSGLFGTFESGTFFAAIALALHTGAYQAEIFRAGFQSVPRGQMEASLALGLTRGETMTTIVLPQTFRLVLPALGNEFATVLKDTSLLAAVGGLELFGVGRNLSQLATIEFGHFEWVFGIWTAIAILYFLLTFALSKGLLMIESRWRVPGLGGVSA